MADQAYTTPQALTPILAVPDPATAIAFYEQAFGAERQPLTLTGPAGEILHAELRIAGVLLMLGPGGGPGVGAPAAGQRDAAVKLNLMVPDPDAVAARAVELGAEILIPVDDQFYGHRSGRIRDPFGHVWILAAETEQLSPAEMQRRLDAVMKQD